MDPTSILKTLSVKEEALLLQIENLTAELNTANQTLTDLQKSKESLETLVNSIATQWAIETQTPATGPTVTQDTSSQEPKSKSKPKRATNKRDKRKSETEPKPEPEPEPEPSTAEQPTEDEEGFIVSHKGIDYVVFPDNLDVVREDDKEEEVVGRWDPENKAIIFN